MHDSIPISGTARERLQALRTIAIVLLIGYHVSLLFQSATRGIGEKVFYLFGNAGWIGTDLFLAIAGFLAYRSLSRHGEGSSWPLKKAIRILPSYWLFLLLYLAAIPALLSVFGYPIGKLSSYGSLDVAQKNWPFLAAAAANLLMATGHQIGAALEPMLTIAVGVQWFVTAFIFMRLCPAKAVPFGIIALELFGFFLRWLFRNDPAWLNYSLPFTRCDAFLLSFLASWAVENRQDKLPARKTVKLASLAAGVLLIVTILATRGLEITRLITSQIGYPLVGLFFTLLVLLAATSHDAKFIQSPNVIKKAGSRLLGWVAGLGSFAYGAYLFKLPAVFLLKDLAGEDQGVSALILLYAASVGLSFLLGAVWFFVVERWFMAENKPSET